MTKFNELTSIQKAYAMGYAAARKKYERPQGEWIKSEMDEGCYCPECRQSGCDDGFMDNYCANCGMKLAPPVGWTVSKCGGLIKYETDN